ncbi:hypothetical protein FOZ63_033664, partial [Perkinsus olseni]
MGLAWLDVLVLVAYLAVRIEADIIQPLERVGERLGVRMKIGSPPQELMLLVDSMGSDTVVVACDSGGQPGSCYKIDASDTAEACRNPAECYADIPNFGDFYDCQPSREMDWHKARRTTHYINLDGPRYFKYEGIEVKELASISSVNESVSIPLRVALDGAEGVSSGVSANGDVAGVLGLARATFTCRNDSTVADFCGSGAQLTGVTLDLARSRLIMWAELSPVA